MRWETLLVLVAAAVVVAMVVPLLSPRRGPAPMPLAPFPTYRGSADTASTVKPPAAAGTPTSSAPTTGTATAKPGDAPAPKTGGMPGTPEATPARTEIATFGGGCFWCVEAVFQRVPGVTSVVSGYSGGTLDDPTYDDICTGLTGHAEVVRVTFDPAVVDYAELLAVFWQTHDPTTLNRQGNDVGTQYRSVIFTHDDRQRRIAEEYKSQINSARVFESPVVTEISPAPKFFPAEIGHQDYYNRNAGRGYCRAVIRPKLDKLESLVRPK